jgi:hypothetical protein
LTAGNNAMALGDPPRSGSQPATPRETLMPPRADPGRQDRRLPLSQEAAVMWAALPSGRES